MTTYTQSFKDIASIFFGLGAKTYVARWQPTPATTFDRLPCPKVGFFLLLLKKTGKDKPKISCSHFVAK